MPLEIFFTYGGPHVFRLNQDRVALFVGQMKNFDLLRDKQLLSFLPKLDGHNNELYWIVVEGKKEGTPKSYRLHLGPSRELKEADVRGFDYTPNRTLIKFILSSKIGQLTISNASPDSICEYNGLEQRVDNIYSLFGMKQASPMLPQGCEQYFDE